MVVSKITAGVLALTMLAPPVDLTDMAAVLAEAERLWSAGENQAVADLFRRAYAESPQPEYLFGRARAEIKQGNCDAGRAHLDQFLATSPPALQVEAARAERDKCPEVEPAPVPVATPPPRPTEPRVAAPPATAVAPAPVLPAPDPDDGGVALDTTQRPWRADAIGWTLVALGGAGLAVGVSLFVVGRSRALSPDPTVNETEYNYETRRGQRIGWAGLGIGSGGIALAIAGAVRLGVLRARWRAADRRASR